MKNDLVLFILFIGFLMAGTWSCINSEETENEPLTEGFQPTPYQFPDIKMFPKNLNIPDDNPMTVEGVKLGRYLFYDGRLSGNTDKDNLMSCATCHIQSQAFEAGINNPQFKNGIPHGLASEKYPNGKPTPNNMLSPVNTVFNRNGYLWNGFINNENELLGAKAYDIPDEASFNYKNVESLVWMSIVAEHEMNGNIEKSVATIASIPMYKNMFKEAFGDDSVNIDRISKSIAQFVRSIVSYQSKFHKFLRNETVLTEQELRGHDLFFSEEADCFHCHGGTILMTTNEYFNNAKDVVTNEKNDRYSVSGDPMDKGAYRAPSLLNVAITAPYMHDGRFKSLDELIDFYSGDLVYSEYVHPLMKYVRNGGVQMSKEEKEDLKAFLNTLTDYELLSAPEYSCPPELKEWSAQASFKE